MVETAFAAESVDSVGPEGLVDQEDLGARLDSVPAAHRLIHPSILLPIPLTILLPIPLTILFPILGHKMPIGESYTLHPTLPCASLAEVL